jgi:hypothetical protein
MHSFYSVIVYHNYTIIVPPILVRNFSSLFTCTLFHQMMPHNCTSYIFNVNASQILGIRFHTEITSQNCSIFFCFLWMLPNKCKGLDWHNYLLLFNPAILHATNIIKSKYITNLWSLVKQLWSSFVPPGFLTLPIWCPRCVAPLHSPGMPLPLLWIPYSHIVYWFVCRFHQTSDAHHCSSPSNEYFLMCVSVHCADLFEGHLSQ